MFGSISRSFHLVNICWRVLMLDKELILFPLISFIFIIPIVLSYIAIDIGFSSIAAESIGTDAINWILLFIFYLLSYFVIIFFNSGLIFAAQMRMQGQDPTFLDGIKGALGRLTQIFVWALISATVNIVLRLLERRFGLIGRIVSGLAGMAWSLGTYFVVPVLVTENMSPFMAIRRSGDLFRRTWGELVVGNFGLGIATFFIMFMWGIISFFMISASVSTYGLSGGILSGSLAGIIYAVIILAFYAMDGIYKAALYEYASTGEVPALFPKETVVDSWITK